MPGSVSRTRRAFSYPHSIVLEHTISGYRNRVITLSFPELAEEGDDIHVVIRNPRLMPAEELRAMAGARSDADLQRLAAAQQAIAQTGDAGDLVTDEDANRGFEMVARLIIGWRVYDATSTAEDQPLLPLPATVESVGKLPQEILTRIMEEVGKANPPRTPVSLAGTGNPS